MKQTRLFRTMQYLGQQNLLETTFKDEAPCLKHTIETLELAGALVLREAFSTRRGTADVVVCYKGNFIAFECKSATGELSDQQIKFLNKVRAAGGIGVEVQCMLDVINALAVFEDADDE